MKEKTIKLLKEENKRLWKAYNILMNYFNYIPDEDKQFVSNELDKINL